MQHTGTDRTTRGLLMVIAALLAVIAIQLSAWAPPLLPAARAQIPDTARQRQEILIEAKRTNALLEDLLEHIRGKPVKVVLVDADKARGPASRSTQ